MIRTLRTYRFLLALVAFALVFNAGMPLVQYVCGVTTQTVNATTVTAMLTQPSDPCPEAAGCRNSPSETQSQLAASLALSPSALCCTVKTADKTPAVMATQTALDRTFLPVVAFLAVDAPYHNISPASWADHGLNAISSSLSVSLRFFVSVFLL